jgi:hypothetical protein
LRRHNKRRRATVCVDFEEEKPQMENVKEFLGC